MRSVTQLVTFLAAVASSLVAGVAVVAAQPSTAAATPVPGQPAGETVDPADVSTLNGQLVPVGEHNEYRYSFRRWNVSTNPIGWMLGSYGVSVSYALTSNIVVRGDVNYYQPTDGVTGSEIGVGLPIYFRRAYQGLFLEPGFITRRFSYDDESTTTAGPQVLVGWHRTWDSGLNAAVALGAGRNWSSEDRVEVAEDDAEPFINGYLRFGYAF